MTQLLVISQNDGVIKPIKELFGRTSVVLHQCRPRSKQLEKALNDGIHDLCLLVEQPEAETNEQLLELLRDTLQPFLFVTQALVEVLLGVAEATAQQAMLLRAFKVQLHNNLEWVERIQSFVPLFDQNQWPTTRAIEPEPNFKDPAVFFDELVPIFERVQEGFIILDRHWKSQFISHKFHRFAPQLASKLKSSSFDRLLNSSQLAILRSNSAEEPIVVELPSDLGSIQVTLVQLPTGLNEQTGFLMCPRLSESLDEQPVPVSLGLSADLFSLLVEQLPDQIYFQDTDQVIRACNSAYAKGLGARSVAEVIGKPSSHWSRLRQPVPQWTPADLAGLATAESVRSLVEIPCQDGQNRFFQLDRVPVHDAAGKVTGVLGIQRDISERLQQEKAVQAAETKLRLMLEYTPIALLTLDLKGNITSLNRPFLVHEVKEMLGSKLEIFYTPDQAEQLQLKLKSVIAERKVLSLELSNLDREAKPVVHKATMGPILEGDQVVGVFLVLTDVTGHKQVEVESQKLAMAIEQAAEIVVITDAAGNIEYVNPAFERITGYRRDEVIGRNPKILQSGKQDAVFYQSMWSTLAKGKVWTGRLTNRKKNGDLYDEELTISPVRDDQGHIVNYVGVKRDTTYEERLKHQLWQNQKLEAIGTLAGGIAHDFNNLLGTILLNISLLGMLLKGNEQAERYLGRSQDAGNRAKELIKQILTFSRQKEQIFQVMDVIPIFRETIKFVQNTLPPNIRVRSQIDLGLAYVSCDPTQLHQVLMNLTTNAAYAMKEREGELLISLTKIVIQQKYAPLYNINAGNYLRLTLTDNGAGMNRETREHIFDPFYTTKPVGEGTGMGLSIVHGIVRNHQGAISVYSEPELGTTFNIFLPLAQGEGLEVELKDDHNARKQTRILLVDDEKMFVESEQELLEQFGFQVTCATDPNRALQLFQKDTSAFDLVITDHNMPGLKGDELSLELIKLRGDLPVILVTGFSEFRSNNKLKSNGIQEVLLKPIITDDLVNSIDRLTSQSRRSYAENSIG